jgi:hypothetical protein
MVTGGTSKWAHAHLNSNPNPNRTPHLHGASERIDARYATSAIKEAVGMILERGSCLAGTTQSARRPFYVQADYAKNDTLKAQTTVGNGIQVTRY